MRHPQGEHKQQALREGIDRLDDRTDLKKLKGFMSSNIFRGPVAIPLITACFNMRGKQRHV
jgi:hypothetical protein